VTEANFGVTTSRGFTQQQLYSTASYLGKNLQGISLAGNDLSGWDLSAQDLSGAAFNSATLANADLTGAVVTGADLTSQDFTKEQLYSTASYQDKDLHGVVLGSCEYWCSGNDLTGWNFSGQNLANSTFGGANVANADFTGSDTRGAFWFDSQAGAIWRNTILPDGTIDGLVLSADERMMVRDDDGVPDPGAQWWQTPRPSIAVEVHNRLATADGSALQLLFDADPWDSLIAFEPGIPVQLGGTLELNFANDVHLASQVGRTLEIFDWTGVSPSGQFEIRSPYVWDTTNLYTTGEVTLIAVPEPSAEVFMVVGIAVLASFRYDSPRRRSRPPHCTAAILKPGHAASR
jgi:hypothetical protein